MKTKTKTPQRGLLDRAVANAGSVCPSVCQSHSWTTYKSFRISKGVLRHTIELQLSFLQAKSCGREFNGSP